MTPLISKVQMHAARQAPFRIAGLTGSAVVIRPTDEVIVNLRIGPHLAVLADVHVLDGERANSEASGVMVTQKFVNVALKEVLAKNGAVVARIKEGERPGSTYSPYKYLEALDPETDRGLMEQAEVITAERGWTLVPVPTTP